MRQTKIKQQSDQFKSKHINNYRKIFKDISKHPMDQKNKNQRGY